MSGDVLFESRDGAAVVTLRQPERFNAMSRSMWRQLRDGFERLAPDRSVRCVLVRGEGGHFCAGGDIAEYPEFRFDPVQLREFHEREVWGALAAMCDCDVPLLAQIDGNCMGAGIEIASCCDIRIAGHSARFGAPIARLGFPMAPRELDLVLRELGVTAARQMLFEAAVFDAPRMLQSGFLSELVPDEQLGARLGDAVQRICALAPLAARANKRSIRALTRRRVDAADADGGAARQGALDRLVTDAYDYADTQEHREGIDAFLAKRRPLF